MLLTEIHEKWEKKPVLNSKLHMFVILLGSKVLQGVWEIFFITWGENSIKIFKFFARRRKLGVPNESDSNSTLLFSCKVMWNYVLFKLTSPFKQAESFHFWNKLDSTKVCFTFLFPEREELVKLV